ARHNARALAAQPNVHAADREAAEPAGVGDAYSQRAATNADPRDHAHRLIVKGNSLDRRGRGRPGADPVHARLRPGCTLGDWQLKPQPPTKVLTYWPASDWRRAKSSLSVSKYSRPGLGTMTSNTPSCGASWR